jgi:hypothetical protein
VSSQIGMHSGQAMFLHRFLMDQERGYESVHKAGTCFAGRILKPANKLVTNNVILEIFLLATHIVEIAKK